MREMGERGKRRKGQEMCQWIDDVMWYRECKGACERMYQREREGVRTRVKYSLYERQKGKVEVA